MHKSVHWLIGLGIFFTGAAAGALGMAAWFTTFGNPMARMERMGPAGFVMERLSAELALSADQREKIDAIVRESMGQSHALREPCMKAEAELFKDATAKIDTLLTPEQAAKHAALIAKMREHGPPHGPPPGPPPGFGFPPPPPPPPPR